MAPACSASLAILNDMASLPSTYSSILTSATIMPWPATLPIYSTTCAGGLSTSGSPGGAFCGCALTCGADLVLLGIYAG